MLVGVPKEIKNNEYRVAVTTQGVTDLVARGHTVIVERDAGLGSHISNEDYADAGAVLVADATEVWETCELVVKVKEPVGPELESVRGGQILFTFLHLAANRPCAEALLAAGTTAIAYETVQLADRTLPLLRPMSEVAGRLAAQVGANHLMAPYGGRGVLLGGVTGAARARVVILGGGVAGEHAAANAVGLGGDVTIVDLDPDRLTTLEAAFDGRLQTRVSDESVIRELVTQADLVIGAVLIPGSAAPKLVTDEMVAGMKPGSVLVDIAIDQGGCFEGSRPTTHSEPTFLVHDAIFYCVANMPGAVPVTSTEALTNVTLPYVLALADKGWQRALNEDEALARGLNTHGGQVFNQGVAAALGLPLATR